MFVRFFIVVTYWVVFSDWRNTEYLGGRENFKVLVDGSSVFDSETHSYLNFAFAPNGEFDTLQVALARPE